MNTSRITPEMIARFLNEDGTLNDAINEGKCTRCGTDGAYVGMTNIECVNPGCVKYSQNWVRDSGSQSQPAPKAQHDRGTGAMPGMPRQQPIAAMQTSGGGGQKVMTTKHGTRIPCAHIEDMGHYYAFAPAGQAPHTTKHNYMPNKNYNSFKIKKPCEYAYCWRCSCNGSLYKFIESTPRKKPPRCPKCGIQAEFYRGIRVSEYPFGSYKTINKVNVVSIK